MFTMRTEQLTKWYQKPVIPREFFFLCFKHDHSLFPVVNFPPSGAKQGSKSLAVLKRLKCFIYQKHFFVNIFFGRKKM